MSNTLSQSPCLIAAYLQGQCENGGKSLRFTLATLSNGLNVVVSSVGSLVPGFIYAPGDGSNACTCSTVTYSMIAACSLCQGGDAGE